jgi:glucose-6-phosphate 1-dehydrogenase
MPDSLFVFGIGGDLAGRYLLPALVELERLERLPAGLSITGTGRDDWDDDALRSYAEEQLDEHGSADPTEARQRLLRRLRYRKVDVSAEDDVRAAVSGTKSLVAYLALPPSLFEASIEALGRASSDADVTVVVEKPFGSDLESARRLNDALHRHFAEERIVRVDHFLHLQTVQNVLGLRFANRILEPLWDSRHVAGVDIVWDEVLALEGRAGYYDDAGALRDVVQNHLLQLFCLVAMEPPASIEERDVRARKVDVLRAVRQFSADDVARHTIRGRYTAGVIDGREVPAYVDEEGVDPEQNTETFAQVTLAVDNWRWAGVPFTLRTGKALAADRHEIVVHFRPVPHLAFGGGQQAAPNVLRLGIEPDRVELELMVSGATSPRALEPARMELALGEQDIPAYGRVLLDAIEGRTGMSIGAEEAEEAWRVFEPVLDAWQSGRPPLVEYPAGSNGPPEASLPR